MSSIEGAARKIHAAVDVVVFDFMHGCAILSVTTIRRTLQWGSPCITALLKYRNMSIQSCSLPMSKQDCLQIFKHFYLTGAVCCRAYCGMLVRHPPQHGLGHTVYLHAGGRNMYFQLRNRQCFIVLRDSYRCPVNVVRRPLFSKGTLEKSIV